jgi:hypothetical protein
LAQKVIENTQVRVEGKTTLLSQISSQVTQLVSRTRSFLPDVSDGELSSEQAVQHIVKLLVRLRCRTGQKLITNLRDGIRVQTQLADAASMEPVLFVGTAATVIAEFEFMLAF